MARSNSSMKAVALVCGLVVVVMLLSIGSAGAKAAGSPIPANNTTVTPSPTPVPTPAPRQVLSAVGWENDHAYVTVTNNGPAIEVEAYLGSASNRSTTTVGPGVSTRVPTTAAAGAPPGTVFRCTFKAYENGTLIDSIIEAPVTVTATGTPTPGPETALVSGVVVDSANNAPISGAEVTFVPRDFIRNYPPAVTGASGSFTTTARMSPGIYYLTVKASGYEPKTVTIMVVDGPQQIDQQIALARASGPSPTPTPGPTVTPTPTPGSPWDAWLSLLYSPTACIGTIALILGAIVSATAIYEWAVRQREKRRREAESKAAEKKDGDSKP